uniref:Uncharacterized protein n=1 Tax=Zea mays TaxID=4577 RepID=B4FXA1_MAIZE|nr:unknown [Zea mays]
MCHARVCNQSNRMILVTGLILNDAATTVRSSSPTGGLEPCSTMYCVHNRL